MKKIRFRKAQTNVGISIKIDMNSMQIVLDEEFENLSLDEIVEQLPDSSPRYFIYSFTYEHKDGRKSYPLIMVYLSPSGVKPEHHMLYAGAKTELARTLGLTKTFELRSVDDLTETWLNEQIKFFG
eukprot:Sdes_comp19813_c0_seq2m11955